MIDKLGVLEDMDTLVQDRNKLKQFLLGLQKNYIHIGDLKQLRKEYINYNIQMGKSELLLRQEYINDFIKYIESRG